MFLARFKDSGSIFRPPEAICISPYLENLDFKKIPEIKELALNNGRTGQLPKELGDVLIYAKLRQGTFETCLSDYHQKN